jgi:hypothetical protein
MFAEPKFQIDSSNLSPHQNWKNDRNLSLFCIVGFKYVKIMRFCKICQIFQKSYLGGIEVGWTGQSL